MRGILVAVLGLAACSCPADISYPKLTAGAYLLQSGTPANGVVNYRMVVSSDGKTVTESFTKAGMSYQVVYQVGASQESMH